MYSYICDVYCSVAFCKVVDILLIVLVFEIPMDNGSRIGSEGCYKRELMREREV